MNGNLARDTGSPNLDYDPLAPHYDQFTAHHDYDAWIGFLLPELRRFGLSGNRMLDVGSGTGKSLAPMLDRGWEVTACDRSAGMLEQLREKFDDRVAVAMADATQLPRLGEFDLVLSLGDVLNYVAAEGAVDDFLRGIRANLAPGGLALIDMSTLATYRGIYATTFDTEVDGHVLRWVGGGETTTSPGATLTTTIEILDESRHSGTPSVHRHRHVPEARMRASLEHAGLECLDLFGHDLAVTIGRPLDESRHTKAICIARSLTHEEEGR